MESQNRPYLFASNQWEERRFSSSIFLLGLGDNHATLPQNWKKTSFAIHVFFLRLVYLFVAVCILLPTTVTWMILQNEIWAAKQRAQAILSEKPEKQQFVLLKFSVTELNTKLRWEHAKEFEFRGNMYDVIESKVVDDTTYIWCWWDKEETTAKKKIKIFRDIIYHNNSTSQKTILHLLLFLKTLFFSEKSPSNSIQFPKKNTTIFWKTSIYKSFSISPPSPPPESV